MNCASLWSMVQDKTDALRATGAQRVISQDCGCLMNIGGAFEKQGAGPITQHVAEFLWERTEATQAEALRGRS